MSVETLIILKRYKFELRKIYEKIENNVPINLVVEKKNLLGETYYLVPILSEIDDFIDSIQSDIDEYRKTNNFCNTQLGETWKPK